MQKNTIQLRLFEYIKKMLPENRSLADDLADVLNLSYDSVYRRLRGNTSLDIEEVGVLCSHYGISFDSFTGDSNNAVFRYNKLDTYKGFEYYLSSILDDMKRIYASENNEIIYAAIDVPIFHHFKYPELSAFKMFYWMKAVVDIPEMEEKKFSIEHVSPQYAELGKAIYDIYTRIPSIEIWTKETINSLVKQIEFFWDSGHFETTEDALKVCEQAKLEIQTLKDQAKAGNKLMQENGAQENAFTLYHCDIEIGNNCIYTKRAESDLVYLSVHTFNKIITGNPEFVKDSAVWLNNLIKKSTLISGVSEKSRYKFFKSVDTKLDRLYEKIQASEE
ncbi:MAG: hypothetical protein U9N85_06985 [Bacteroidota bacterium]|nr:hypothetical protein [Bacteroidota bacterium]